ncbi:MAG: hypothetical protein AAFP79_15510 [Pseudomonadota bacterium]
MTRAELTKEEHRFLSRYAVRSIFGFRWRHPKGTPANLAVVESLEARGFIKRKVSPSGFVNFELTVQGRTALNGR